MEAIKLFNVNSMNIHVLHITCKGVVGPFIFSQDTLPSSYEYHICSYQEVNGGYTTDLRVAITTKEMANRWVADYQEKSKVTLRVKATKPDSGKVNLLVIYYRCQHNTLPRTSSADQKRSSKNTSCPAEVNVTLKRFMGNKSRYTFVIIAYNIGFCKLLCC